MTTTTRGSDTLKTGIFVAFAILLFVFSIYFLGSERDIFASQVNFYVAFNDVKGLAIGAPVKLGGVIIGRVSDIEFAGENTELKVTLSVNEKYLPRIRLDSRVSLETAGLLGDKFVSVSVGRDPQTAAPKGFLPVSTEADTSELIGKAAKVVDNTVQISDDVRSLVSSVRGEGGQDVAQAIREFRELVESMNSIAKEVKIGNGLAHALIYDKSGGHAVASIADLTKNLADASNEVAQIVKDIKSNDGLLKELVYNKDGKNEGLHAMLKKLNDSAENLRQATEHIKNGGGSVGALLVDSKLYDNLVEITDGAKRSFILRQAIRSSLNNSK